MLCACVSCASHTQRERSFCCSNASGVPINQLSRRRALPAWKQTRARSGWRHLILAHHPHAQWLADGSRMSIADAGQAQAQRVGEGGDLEYMVVVIFADGLHKAEQTQDRTRRAQHAKLWSLFHVKEVLTGATKGQSADSVQVCIHANLPNPP